MYSYIQQTEQSRVLVSSCVSSSSLSLTKLQRTTLKPSDVNHTLCLRHVGRTRNLATPRYSRTPSGLPEWRHVNGRHNIKNLLRTKVRYCSVLVSESVVICQLTLKMTEEIDFENRRISNFKGLVKMTLTVDRFIRHTVIHHSSTSTYIPNFIGIGKTFCRQTDGHLSPM